MSVLLVVDANQVNTATAETTAPVPATNLAEVPNAYAYWPKCTSDTMTYCFESATRIKDDGSEIGTMDANPYVFCHTNGQTAGACLTDGSYWLEVGASGTGANSLFPASAIDTTYHWTLRTGKFSPDILMLGNTQRTKVSGSATDGWKLEIWAKPALRAFKDGCWSPDVCGDTTIAESVTYGLIGYMRTLGVASPGSHPKVDTPELRDALRGTFISTNGMSQSWDFKSDTFRVTAVSPHFLTDGATVTPGYVKVFLPSAYVLGTKGYASLAEVTSENIALTVSNAEAKATVAVLDGGLLIDTGVTHYSAPSPTVRLKSKTETSGPSSVTTTTSAPSSSNLTGSRTPGGSLSKGSTRLLSVVYKTKASQKPKWSASGACSIKGSKLVAKSSSGSCTVTVRVLNSKKKYVVAARKTYVVS